MTIDPRDRRADRRHVDMGVGMNGELIGRAQGVVAMRTGSESGLDRLVRVLGKRTSYAGAAGAGRFAGRIGQVRLLSLRGRQAGVVRSLRWRRQHGFQFADARGQPAGSRRLPSATDETWQVWNDALTGNLEPTAEVVPECDAEEGIATVAVEIAACSGADLTAGGRLSQSHRWLPCLRGVPICSPEPDSSLER